MAQKLYNTKFVVANMTKIVANDKISTSVSQHVFSDLSRTLP
jgi:hypothetical protein